MTEHRHAAVLRAIADGKEVEWRRTNGESWSKCGESFGSADDRLNPFMCPNLEWRVKPEPKPDVVWFLNVHTHFTGSFFDTLERAIACASSEVEGRMKITFDGETGKLKSAEVL